MSDQKQSDNDAKLGCLSLLAFIAFLAIIAGFIFSFANAVFIIFLIISFICLILGLIKPNWIGFNSRKQVSSILIPIVAFFFIFTGITAPDTDTQKVSTEPHTGQVDSTHETNYQHKDEHKKTHETTKSPQHQKKQQNKKQASVHKKKDGNKKSGTESSNKSHKTNTKKPSHKETVPADLIPVTVSKNVDGDTIHVNLHGRDEQIRMLLIDTPEDVHPSKPVEPFGRDAAAYAESKLPVGKKIYIKEGIEKRDKYGRLLAYVFITPKDMYNFDVVKEGYARVGYVYNDTTYLSKLRVAEDDAKVHHRRIWSIPGYVDAANDTYSLSIACDWAAKHRESTRGCSDHNPSSTAKSHSTGSESTATHHSSTHSSGSSKSSSSRSPNSSSHPAGCNIKGSVNHIYHVPGGAYYDRTTHVVQWFCSEAEAQKAGYRRSKR